MRHTFSAQFLKILPPATNFGEAWENLCLSLLRADSGDNTIMRLGPPDRGIDIYRQTSQTAYQRKSNENGVFGTIDPNYCISSLESHNSEIGIIAVSVRSMLPVGLYSAGES